VDILEDKGVSWGAYLETMPYTGYTAEVGDKYYYRKHNPLVTFSYWCSDVAQISYQSVAGNATRVAHIKNLTMFYTDLENGQLPQVIISCPRFLNCSGCTSRLIF
jgi:acid phosphatase